MTGSVLLQDTRRLHQSCPSKLTILQQGQSEIRRIHTPVCVQWHLRSQRKIHLGHYKAISLAPGHYLQTDVIGNT